MLRLIDFLLSFNYQLSGEVAFHVDLLKKMRFATNWGVEIFKICQFSRRIQTLSWKWTRRGYNGGGAQDPSPSMSPWLYKCGNIYSNNKATRSRESIVSRIKHCCSQVAFAYVPLTYEQYSKDIIERLYAFYSNLWEHWPPYGVTMIYLILFEIPCINMRNIYPKGSKGVINRKITYFMVVYEGQGKI